jgi:hypothetical protein
LISIALAACLAHAHARPGRTVLQVLNSTSVATVPDPTESLDIVGATMDGTTDSSKVTCRGEPLCLTQVCNPDAYKHDLATAGSEFPYSVSYTTTNSMTDTTFVFMVCSRKGQTCRPNSIKPACAPLQTFQLRVRDDLLETGRSLLAEPAGTNWASCKPQGPGYLWDTLTLGNLTVAGSADTCQSLSITVASDMGTPATLADVCQQNVTIVSNKGESVFNGATLPPFCFFSMSNTAGVTAFGSVMEPLALSNLATAEALAAAPAAYGPTAARRRSLRAAQASTRPGRLF